MTLATSSLNDRCLNRVFHGPANAWHQCQPGEIGCDQQFGYQCAHDLLYASGDKLVQRCRDMAAEVGWPVPSLSPSQI
jgi:hypothetical protein